MSKKVCILLIILFIGVTVITTAVYGVTKNNSLNETKDTNVVETSINLENNNGVEAINMPEMPVNPEITGEKSNQSSNTSSSSGISGILIASTPLLFSKFIDVSTTFVSFVSFNELFLVTP